MQVRQRQRLVAVSALFALTLAACGGGGGGGDTVATSSPGPATGGTSGSPSASGPAAPAPTVSAPAGAPVAAAPSVGGTPVAQAPSGGPPGPAAPQVQSPVSASAFTAFSPVQVGTTSAVTPQLTQPNAVTRLVGGGGVVVFASANSLRALVIDASGKPVSATAAASSSDPHIDVSTIHAGFQPKFSVAALADGSWVVAWVNSNPPSPDLAAGRLGTQDFVQFKRYSASGALLQDTTAATGTYFGIYPGIQVRGTADGGFALAWAAQESLVPPSVAFQRFDAQGAKSGALVNVAAFDGGAQRNPRLLALPDNSLEVLWQQSTQTDSTTRTVAMAHYDASSSLVGTATQFPQSTSGGDFHYAAAVLADGRIGLAWDESTAAAASRPMNVSWAISDVAGALQTHVASLVSSSLGSDDVQIAPAADGGFLVFSQMTVPGRPIEGLIRAVAVGKDGTAAATGWTDVASHALQVEPPTSPTPTEGPGDPSFSVSGGSDGHYLLSYEVASPGAAIVEVMGQ